MIDDDEEGKEKYIKYSSLSKTGEAYGSGHTVENVIK
jgi:hypothetical protein